MKFAVILCGSGFKDGSEIRESVAALYSLSKNKIDFQCFSLNENQTDVMNCLTGKNSNEQRNQLVESARIARGDVLDLNLLNPKDYSALIMPGGFGAAKNLCDLAFKGPVDGVVHPKIKSIINDFFDLKKPIGAICISPAIVAMALKNNKISLTLGENSEFTNLIESLGHIHVVKKSHEAHSDIVNKIVTTPAYMNDNAPLCDIFDGIDELIKSVVKLA